MESGPDHHSVIVLSGASRYDQHTLKTPLKRQYNGVHDKIHKAELYTPTKAQYFSVYLCLAFKTFIEVFVKSLRVSVLPSGFILSYSCLDGFFFTEPVSMVQARACRNEETVDMN